VNSLSEVASMNSPSESLTPRCLKALPWGTKKPKGPDPAAPCTVRAYQKYFFKGDLLKVCSTNMTRVEGHWCSFSQLASSFEATGNCAKFQLVNSAGCTSGIQIMARPGQASVSKIMVRPGHVAFGSQTKFVRRLRPKRFQRGLGGP